MHTLLFIGTKWPTWATREVPQSYLKPCTRSHTCKTRVWGPEHLGILFSGAVPQFEDCYAVDLILIGMISFVSVLKATLITSYL